MQIRPDVTEVRSLVRRTLAELGVTDLSELSETLLVQDGKCFARSYRVDRYMAMWLIGVGLLQFYDEDGNMLRTANLFSESLPHRAAA